MECSEYKNTVFKALNVGNDGIVIVTFEKFSFKFFVAKAGGPLVTIIRNKDGYIECISQDKKYLYIYIGSKDLSINSNLGGQIDTRFYFISDIMLNSLGNDMFSFRFSGGIINKVFPAFPVDVENFTDEEITVNKNNMSINIKMNVLDQNAELQFDSLYGFTLKNEKGINITAGDSSLNIIGHFRIWDLFKIETLLSRVFSFMAFRKVVNNFKTELLINFKTGEELTNEVIGVCYYNPFDNSSDIEISKPFVNILTIHKLGADRFKKLYEIINCEDEDQGFNIDFVPVEGKVEVIDKIRVKETVTTIECLLNLYNVCSINTKTKDLIEKLKNDVDQANDKDIDKDIKDQIKSLLRHANNPVKKRIFELYKNEESEIKKYLDVINKLNSNCVFDDPEKIIKDTIKYRDYNTHNSVGFIDYVIMNGVILFDAIIYAKVLKEIGFLEDNIGNLLIECLK